jgi:hypothetical protein
MHQFLIFLWSVEELLSSNKVSTIHQSSLDKMNPRNPEVTLDATDYSEPARGSVGKEKQDFVCCAGTVLCKRPDLQHFADDDCEHCDEECHVDCGEFLDVPHKIWFGIPGFYCQQCISILPRHLYPKMPRNGKPKNIDTQKASLPLKPMNPNIDFKIFMNKQETKWARRNYTRKKRAKKSR